MLFKIANLLILADNEIQAKQVFIAATAAGRNIDTHCITVETLIPEGENFVQITPNLMCIDTLDSLYYNCISSIIDKYQDTNGAVDHMVRYISELDIGKIIGLFQALIETEYNETKPILTLVQAMINSNIPIPSSWHKPIRRHISRFWIRLNYDTGEWYLDQNNLILLKVIVDGRTDSKVVEVTQLDESDHFIEELEGMRTQSSIRRLLNSVNFSYDTLYEYAMDRPEHLWILDHYEFKQKLIRECQVLCTNATATEHSEAGT